MKNNGINVHLAPTDVLFKLKFIGINWVRIDIDWNFTEYNKGEFNWNEIDRVINYCNNNKIDIYASIGYTPGWANDYKGIHYSPTNRSDWEKFIRKVCKRYGSKLKYFGIWNEMNLHFWKGSKKEYLEDIFQPAVRIIRSYSPYNKICGPDLTHMTGIMNFLKGNHWYIWMKYLLKNVGHEYDVISHHIYKENVHEIFDSLDNKKWYSLIPTLESLVSKYTEAIIPFWITETGWCTDEYTDVEQSDKIIDLYRHRDARNWPENLFIYSAYDDPNPGVKEFGILDKYLKPKKSYFKIEDYLTFAI